VLCGGRFRFGFLLRRGGSFTTTGAELQLLIRRGRTFSSAGSVDLARAPPQHRLKPGN
jgi:hypothetical protein